MYAPTKEGLLYFHLMFLSFRFLHHRWLRSLAACERKPHSEKSNLG